MEPGMIQVIALDPYVLAFLDGNMITLTLTLGILKIFAQVTPWSKDDKIIESLGGLFHSIRSRGKGA